ncbi:beta-lactamase family protein [Methanogenium sp. S4BF]|uniref:serine hydrolase domain-containing protein n=1 Tax=Methanogenium sp. S4BF TaxID=1789226 RepID=UPI0024180036|nr:serine hydrolase domain-containing protein [Methanogenium sp. S4BF]WFN34390.1 beta-lactamase family protein [Methanogenium sp. S4BF]
MSIIVLMALFLLACPPVHADGTGPSTDQELINPSDVEAFFNTAVPAGLAEYNIPGAVVSVVQDGELIFAKGYGYSDIDSKNTVDPEATHFHIGSITKLFTWTCVMQLVEEGRIDLDTDVNTYLTGFSLPDTYPGQPVTMRHLMTHSAGFEEQEVHFAVADAADLYSFRIYCRDNIPAIVYPPGTVTAYSNYGTTLAAVIIEDITGIPYGQYVQENILTPLGMTDTIVSYPLTPEADAATASGYHYTGEANVAVPDTVFVIGPAGTISSTAADMAKFAAVHMENGTWNGVEILSSDTASLMHAPAFANDPRVSSMCLGFYENHIEGERIITHGGDTDTFHSLLVIIPERKTGYFVSYNSPGGNSARNDLLMAFVDHFFPDDDETATGGEPAGLEEAYDGTAPAPSVQAFAGTYQSTRHNYRTFEYYLSPPQQIQAAAGEGGTILLMRSGKTPTPYTEIEPGVFAQTNGANTYAGDVVFRENADGDVTLLCLENVPIMAFERVPWYGTDGFVDAVKNAATIILLTALLWPLMAICRRAYSPDNGEMNADEPTKTDKRTAPSSQLPFCARMVTGTAALLVLLFVLILLPAVTADAALIQSYMFDRTTPPALAMALSVPVIAALLSVASTIFLLPVWRRSWWTLRHRLHYTLVVIGLFLMMWWVNYWNLLVFRV